MAVFEGNKAIVNQSATQSATEVMMAPKDADVGP